MKVTPQQRLKMKIRDFESREVFKLTDLKNKLRPTGYEAFRISPRATMKYGKMYKKIYGATVSPDYSRPIGKKNKFGNPVKFGAKVQWFSHGYTSAKAKGGTYMLQPLRSYPVDQVEARRKLMIKRKY